MKVRNSQLARYGFRGLGEDVPFYLAKAQAPANEAPYYVASPTQPHSEGNPYTVSNYVATAAPAQESNFLRAIPLVGDLMNAVVPNVAGKAGYGPIQYGGKSNNMMWLMLGGIALVTVGGAVLLARSS